tara:strand:- start:271 stop:495 length:225 start_codon:yes stop_codon:yes gene_type:complete
MSRKKPTAMELKNAVTNLIEQQTHIMQALRAIDVTLGSYIEFKKDTKKFTKWMENKAKEQDMLAKEQKQDKEAK